MKKYILLLLFAIPLCASAQNRGNVWCFGDSAGIDFNSGTATPINTGLDTRGSCVSIADYNGNLSFYAFTQASTPGISGLVKNSQHITMQNGDSILGQGWYNEMVIVPAPGEDSVYFLFSIGVTLGTTPGLFYTVIEFSNGFPLGEVIQKNIQLQNFETTDCLTAIKHGNGRDWWIIFRPATLGSSNNEFWLYLVSPSGIGTPIIQNVGSGNSTNLGKITFSPEGNKMVFANYMGLVEMFDFDRCTGIISNPLTIHPENPSGNFLRLFGCEFAPNSNILYISTTDLTSYLFQFDLTASNIFGSIDTLWSTNFLTEGIGQIKLGKDGKIYQSGPDTSPLTSTYPYSDSLYTNYNMNLGVINSPDNLGITCDFQPYSFYLGGKRTYWGLPNNPDYDLGPLTGSPCDTIVGINETASATTAELFVYYDQGWQTTFINADNLSGRTYNLTIYDIAGKQIFSENGKIFSSYFNKNFNCNAFSSGIYLVNFQTEKENISRKFVIH